MRNSESLQKLTAPTSTEENGEEEEETGWWWWSPRQNSLFVSFCNETSIHGFKFIGQEKRHFSERIFWMVGFFMSLGTAIYLIYNVWDRYQKVPVIVSFQSSEQDVDSIPFPAVTLCNMNKFPKSKVEELRKISQDPKSTPGARAQAKKDLVFVRNLCNSQQSFAKEMGFAFMRGSRKRKYRFGTHDDDDDTIAIDDDSQIEMTDFFMKNTLECGQLIRLCMLGEIKMNCSDLFKPIITDYGKCNESASPYDNPVLGSLGEKNWPPDELKEWKKWNYDEGFVLERNASRPWRQKRAGLPYGLSILVDPNTEEYFCPASDSEGMRYILHTPLELPHVMEFSSVANMGKEILIEVHPDVINADDDIRYIEHEKRLCFFGKERPLKFFKPYTGGNCIDECLAKLLQYRCNCSAFYMPRDDEVAICDSDPESADHKCVDHARQELQAQLKDLCTDCDTLCEDIAYNYETTIAELQNASKLWGDPNPAYNPKEPPAWLKHKMSIIHIFFGAESTVPKFRKRLYGTTDLIANTGGILGLCLGFSILSGVEVLYFLTLRSFWTYCRKRIARRKRQRQQQKQANQNFVTQMLFQKQRSKVIHLNPNMIPVYPHDTAFAAAGGGFNGYQRVIRNFNHLPPPAYINGLRCWENIQGQQFYGEHNMHYR